MAIRFYIIFYWLYSLYMYTYFNIKLDNNPFIIFIFNLFDGTKKVFNEDLRKKDKIIGISAKTFFIDPPYTKNWILLFIYKWLQLLTFNNQDIQEFYVIINQSMTKNFIDNIQLILSSSWIRIHEIRPWFSNYHLPKSYAEYARAMKFLDNHGISQEKLIYSSSSSLYILRTKNPNLDLLWENINITMIYDHSIF